MREKEGEREIERDRGCLEEEREKHRCNEIGREETERKRERVREKEGEREV